MVEAEANDEEFKLAVFGGEEAGNRCSVERRA